MLLVSLWEPSVPVRCHGQPHATQETSPGPSPSAINGEGGKKQHLRLPTTLIGSSRRAGGGCGSGARPFAAPQGQQMPQGCSGPRGWEGCSVSPRSGTPVSKQHAAARQLPHGNVKATPSPQGARGRMRPAPGQRLPGVPAGTRGLPRGDRPRHRQAPNVTSPREP